ncbi:thiamine pyrophosphate-dependent enzyme [Tepidanaerobacter acetatoxydans]|uniref:thiamine pyrophosphate-dependent enzyme n=1 Tax=Tepidanaerobacter acetatoxydans TaxID=499229 RepID=UPI001BD26BC7|nr:thiamine pyrophosphate-dependent enzyme [Tepidanaerobacter acetatoxydans]
MEKIYERPHSLYKSVSGYCPGCLHGLISKMVCELIDEYEIADKTICVLPVGCGTLSKNIFDFDVVCAAHGRAPAVATGVKRCAPEKFVFTYQGDGDLAAIGLSEIIHCANRGENIVTIFINNSTYGMTGGQMAPTTLIGQKTTTTPAGRNAANEGYPIKMCELISQLEAPVYVARFALDTPANIIKAKNGLKKAFEIQLNGHGFSFIEFLSICPTNWGMTPEKCLKWSQENCTKVFPPGEFKVRKEVQ